MNTEMVIQQKVKLLDDSTEFDKMKDLVKAEMGEEAYNLIKNQTEESIRTNVLQKTADIFTRFLSLMPKSPDKKTAKESMNIIEDMERMSQEMVLKLIFERTGKKDLKDLFRPP